MQGVDKAECAVCYSFLLDDKAPTEVRVLAQWCLALRNAGCYQAVRLSMRNPSLADSSRFLCLFATLFLFFLPTPHEVACRSATMLLVVVPTTMPACWSG